MLFMKISNLNQMNRKPILYWTYYLDLYDTCRINHPHNSKVVGEITKAIGTEKYSEEMIHHNLKVISHVQLQGCRTYCKTIAAREKPMTTHVKRKKQLRSRKQRVSAIASC